MTIAARSPALSLPIARLTGHGVVVDDNTDIVIEGYPKSANSFAVAAFIMAQAETVKVAHHTHTPAQVVDAARRRIPAVVLVRRPADCASEFVAIKPDISMGQAVRGWIRFYEPLLAYGDSFVVGLFDEVISDFGAVIRRVNERFATVFREFRNEASTVEATADAADGYFRARTGSGLPFVGRTTAPPAGRGDELRRASLSRYESPALARLRARAERLYEVLSAEPTAPRR